MKPKSSLRSLLFTASVLSAGSLAYGQTTYYWDGNNDTANFATATGTWAAPTAGTLTSGWSTDATGATIVDGNSVTTATNDSLNFGTNIAGRGLATGPIAVTGTVNAGNITYGSQSGSITLGSLGNTINFGTAPVVTVNTAAPTHANGANPYSSGTWQFITSALTGAGTSFTKSGVGALVLNSTSTTFNPGSISVTSGNLYVGGNNATSLNSGNYTGNISISSGATYNHFGTATQTYTTGVISGDGNFIKRGAGIITLSGANTYTGKTSFIPQVANVTTTANVSSFNSVVGGVSSSSLGAPTTVANGTIQLGNGNVQGNVNLTYTGAGETTDRVLSISFNNSASHTLTANTTGGGLLKFTSNLTLSGGTSGNFNLAGSGAGEISGNIPNFGTTGKLIINSSGSGSWTLSGNNSSLTKGVTLTAGKLNINSANALGATAGTFTISGGTFDNTTAGLITNANNNAIAWNGDSTFTGTRSLDLGTGAVTLGGNRAIVVSANTLTVGGVVGGAFNITLGGNGTLALTNEASTYTGKTSIGNNTAGGSLRLQVSKLADLSATSSLGAPTTAANGLIQIGRQSNGSTLELTDGTSASLTNRQVSVGSNENGSGGATIQNNNTDPTHTLTFSNAAFNVANASVAGFNRPLTLSGSNTGDNTIAGAIINTNGPSNAIRVIKSGAGTWILSSPTHSYSGSTTVSDGKLTIASTGNINSTSGVSIGAGEFNYNASTALSQPVTFSGTGGILSGSGTIIPSVNVTSGNTLAIGNSTGTMNFSTDLTVVGTYLYELTSGGITADLGDVAGNLILGGILDLVQIGTYMESQKFTLFAYDGTLSGLFKDSGGINNIPDDTQFTDAGGIWVINYNDTTPGLNGGVSATNRFVTITAIPEPNVTALIGVLGGLFLLRRRR